MSSRQAFVLEAAGGPDADAASKALVVALGQFAPRSTSRASVPRAQAVDAGRFSMLVQRLEHPCKGRSGVCPGLDEVAWWVSLGSQW